MLIGLISDTHIAWEYKELPPEVFEIFQGVDLIFHAGDIYSHSVLDDLEKIAPVLAAQGDDDYETDDPRIQDRHILELEGQTIWLVHEGPSSPLNEHLLNRWCQYRSHGENGAGKPDIIIAGHEHRTILEHCDGVLHVNPGSPTLLHYRRGPGTVALLKLDSGKADARIIHLQSPPST